MNRRKLAEKQDIFISVVVVLRPEVERADKMVKKLFRILDVTYTNYEIILVDNGISLSEFERIATLLNKVPCIRIIRLSHNLKIDAAFFAGLDVSIGDYVCTLDLLTDGIGCIVPIIEMNQTYDVVQGVNKIPANSLLSTGLGRRIFYWYNRKYIGIDIPLHATYHASYSRRAINSLTAQAGRHTRLLRHMSRKIGYGYATMPYETEQSSKTQKNIRNGVVEALEIVSSYSTHPLRYVAWLGLAAGALNLLYACYVVILFLTSGSLEPGWASQSMQLSVMFFILFLILTILSEYIGRILAETQRDPEYYISEELSSTAALANAGRKNTTH